MHKTQTIASSQSSTRRVRYTALGVLFASVAIAGGCGDDDNKNKEGTDRPDLTGAECAAAADCYPGVDPMTLSGAAECLADARDGYCTHACGQDTDCCAAEGECKTDLVQVCAPFESHPGQLCFLSCESTDLRNPDGTANPDIDPQEYCQRAAGSDFECRASGGGDPRKICFPVDCGVGADCAAAGDCAAGLECITAFEGGYCGKGNCTVHADCPADSYCVTARDGENYCFKSCAGNTDCSLCRHEAWTGDCTDQVTFAEPLATPVAVCVP